MAEWPKHIINKVISWGWVCDANSSRMIVFRAKGKLMLQYYLELICVNSFYSEKDKQLKYDSNGDQQKWIFRSPYILWFLAFSGHLPYFSEHVGESLELEGDYMGHCQDGWTLPGIRELLAVITPVFVGATQLINFEETVQAFLQGVGSLALLNYSGKTVRNDGNRAQFEQQMIFKVFSSIKNNAKK